MLLSRKKHVWKLVIEYIAMETAGHICYANVSYYMFLNNSAMLIQHIIVNTEIALLYLY